MFLPEHNNMKILLKGSSLREGFYLKRDLSGFWIGHKDSRGDTHERRISEKAFLLLKKEAGIPRQNYKPKRNIVT